MKLFKFCHISSKKRCTTTNEQAILLLYCRSLKIFKKLSRGCPNNSKQFLKYQAVQLPAAWHVRSEEADEFPFKGGEDGGVQTVPGHVPTDWQTTNVRKCH